MGKIGRIACIALPGLLTVGSLITMLIVFMGGLNKGDGTERGLYLFQANTTALKQNISTDSSLLDSAITNQQLLDALKQNIEDKKIYDYYEVYLWNYCAGNSGGNASADTPDFCSPRTAGFWFNPIEVWGLNNTDLDSVIPKGLTDGLKAYHTAAKWQFTAYTIAFWATVASFVLGFLAIFSRWGSLLTSVASGIASLFAVVSAISSTVLASTLTGAVNSALKGYGIHLSIGTRMLSADWIAAAFSIGASLFWFVSICCCSGKSSHPYSRDAYASRGRGRGNGEKAFAGQDAFASGGRGYQPVGEGQQPWGAQQRGVEMDNFGGQSPYNGRETAYEPFRHERV